MLEMISELEHKVGELLSKVEQSKNDLNHMRGEIDEKNNYIHEVEEANGRLEAELEELRGQSADKNRQFDESADRMRNLLSRINTSGQE